MLLLLFLIRILFWIYVRDSRLEKCAWLFEQNVSRLEMPPRLPGENVLPPAWLHCPAAASRRVRQGVGTSCQPSSCRFQPCLLIHHFESQNQGLDAEEGQSRGEGARSARLRGGLGSSYPMGQELNLPLGARDPAASCPPVQRELPKSRAKARFPL